MNKIVTHKVCGKCKTNLPISSFRVRSGKRKNEYTSYCISCNKQTLKEHRKNHPEVSKKYRDNNKEYVNELSRNWRLSNPERFKSNIKKHYELHKSEYIQRAKSRRSRILGAEGSFTLEDWNNLVKSYGNKCLCCGKKFKILTQDHVIPLSKGGTNWITNIQPLCKSCNSKKHVDTTDYRPAS